jgi:hypothetical protein
LINLSQTKSLGYETSAMLEDLKALNHSDTSKINKNIQILDERVKRIEKRFF